MIEAALSRGLPPPLFDHLRELLAERAGLELVPGKDYLVRSHLSAVARRHGLEGTEPLLTRLKAGRESALEREVVEAMTVPETSFFREPHAFAALRTGILPRLLRRPRAEGPVVLWSAGCATGQEPYSLAMHLLEWFPEAASRVRIVALDLSREALTRARAGRYSQLEVNRGLPAACLVKYFDQAGLAWQVRPEVAALVEFSCVNLAGAWPVLPRPDVVFARHVLMYLHLAARRALLARLREHLAPDGWLFLGGTESLRGVTGGFEQLEIEGAPCYRPGRPEGGAG